MSTEEGNHSFEVTDDMDRQRADRALHAEIPELSRSRVQSLFDNGLVWRDDNALDKGDKVYARDMISYEIPPVRESALVPADIPLNVLFEDEDMIAVNKAPGMVVHPGAGTGGDTLVHALLHHCNGELSGIGGEERPGIVHRLDKETSGVIVAAKSDRAFLSLSRSFANRHTDKCYLAVVCGSPSLPGGTVDASIGRHPVNRLKMCVREDGRTALSEWELAEHFGDRAALLRVRIHTGRTHQVRVHMAHIGYPLAGDTLYGWHANKWPEAVSVPRIMLHAWKLALPHPVTHEQLELEAPVPEDFLTMTARLRSLA